MQDAAVERSCSPSPSPAPEIRESRACRYLDLGLATAAMMFFLPLMLIIGFLIWVESRGPVFYSQMRIGRGGRMFPCFKFRTMVVDSDSVLRELLETCAISKSEWERDFKLRDDPRITRVGRVLRKFSLDELPQLFNVLRGEMSVVGPRPIVKAEVARYGKFIGDYASVKPGLTGLWQISGRNDVSYAERVELDVQYARSKSLANDVQIIARTVPAVLFARGAY
jgi:lipopolysaccharide/colanic/teichoic acid biosynthesis glycosyltransferase